MNTLAMTTELWAVIGTIVGTVLLLAPGVVYAWYALEDWIGDDKSYDRVVASIKPMPPPTVTRRGRASAPTAERSASAGGGQLARRAA
jgi:hypothetical protein